jgi:Zn-dependent protease with chaperone function
MTPTAKFKFKYTRRPLFLLITLLLPAVFMGLLNIFVFFLPQDSGERIGFAITLLLTVVVYMTIAQELLPATAMPRLSALCVMLMVNLFMSGMIVLSVIVSAWYYYKPDDEQIPKWLFRS